MKIVMVGTGYVGLTSGACFAHMGHHVTCVDINDEKIQSLSHGVIPIHEPNLEDMVKATVATGHLTFTTDMSHAMQDAAVAFIGVGTPPDDDGRADLQYVFQAARDIAKNTTDYVVIVDKSTVPVGTANRVADCVREENPELSFDVVSNPEFLREGSAVDDFLHPDRIVMGANSERAKAVMAEIYAPLTTQGYPMHITGVESAEMIKYATNAFLATKISFINQIADVCELAGADVMDVAHGLGMDDRIGAKFLHPGPGYGGSCFPKDTLALVQTAQDLGADTSVVQAVITYNRLRQLKMVDKIERAMYQYAGGLSGKTIAILGVAFKGNTDDMRDSPALTIIPELQSRGAKITAYDPQAMDNAQSIIFDVHWKNGVDDCVTGADAVVILTEWQQFGQLDLQSMGQKMQTPLCIDLRNMYDLSETKGITYVSIGRDTAE